MRAIALAAVLALAVPAAGAEVESTFVVRFESDENAALQSLESLGMTVARAWQALEEPGDWDAERFGAYAIVRRGAEYRVRSPLPGEATVTVTIAPAEPVPSESKSAQALAAAFLSGVRSDAESRITAWRERALSAPRASVTAAEEGLAEALIRAKLHRNEWGDVATEHRIAASRLEDAAADLARTRIDLAVAARRLEAARKAVDRAFEADEIRRRADAIERELETGQWADPGVPEKMRADIAALRTALAEAERRSPPLADSRRLVFDLEVDVVGLEARKAALQPEIEEIRKRVVELLGAAAESRVIAAELAAAHTSRSERRSQLRQLETRLAAAAVVVVTPPSPGAPRKR